MTFGQTDISLKHLDNAQKRQFSIMLKISKKLSSRGSKSTA